MVVVRQSDYFCRQNGFIGAEVVVFDQKWFYSGKSVLIREKWLYSGEKGLYSGRVVEIGQ